MSADSRSRFRTLAAVLLAAAAAVVLAEAASSKPAKLDKKIVTRPHATSEGVLDVHDVGGQPHCQGCHAGPDSGKIKDPMTVCTRCHSIAHSDHPIGSPMKGWEKVKLPLTEDHRVVCHSCHDPHRTKRKELGLRLKPAELCSHCHTH